jgi:hypothetical protein
MRKNALSAALFALAAATISLTSQAAAAPSSVDALLAQARTAVGGSAIEHLTSLRQTGTVEIGGVHGTFDQWNDYKAGAFAGFTSAGPFSGGDGFDGTVAWSQDASGVVWVDGGKARHYTAIANAYVNSADVLRPQRRGVVTSLGRRTDTGVAYDVVQATPPNGLPLEIWFNATTHLPARTIITVGTQVSTTKVSDYRSVAGVKIPYRESTTSDQGNTFDVTLTSAQANPPDIAAHIGKPVSHVTDASMTSGTETTVPIELIDNHVYLSVMLNGKGPYRFIFDTGGANIVDTAVAREIGATAAGSLQGGGVGNQNESFSFTKLAALTVGNAKITDQYFAVVPIRQSFGVAGGAPADGLIGFEVLARFVTTFDYGRSTLTLRMPGTSAPQQQAADTIPFVFNDTIPQIACQIDGIAADCTVDTGSRASASVTSPFIAAHPNIVPPDATAVGIDGFGVGGPAMGRLGRLASLQIGKTVLNGLIGDFSVQKQGFFANPFIAANVGGGVWRRFAVTFDYANQTISLVPNAALNERETYDRSGAFLINQRGEITVLAARPQTPADKAGLARGDVITAIGGKPATGFTLAQVRDMFKGAPGTNITLTLKAKDGQTRDVVLTLADYV